MFLFRLLFALLIFVPVVTADAIYTDERHLLLELNSQELGDLNYGHFLTCLKTAIFNEEVPDRRINRRIKRLVVTELEGKKWFFEIREEIGAVIIEGITVNTHHYADIADRRRLLLHLFAHCRITEDDPEQD